MNRLHRFPLPIALTLCFCLVPNPGAATVGLAEWEVYTPGGNIISNSDSWQDLCGDGACLRADTSEQNSGFDRERSVFISDLERWRFYNESVVGKTKSEYFIFNEVSKKITKYGTEQQFLEALKAANLGEPKSPWLTKEDAWEEAWFPILIWEPCQRLLKGEINSSQTGRLGEPGLSKEVCQQKLAPNQFVQYQERTWGRQCKRVNFDELSQERSERRFQEFCKQIMETK